MDELELEDQREHGGWELMEQLKGRTCSDRCLLRSFGNWITPRKEKAVFYAKATITDKH
jgi:hypothetical protein